MRYPQIAAQVKEARLHKGWSQERAAAEVGTSRIHWIRWEKGLHKPAGRLAARLIEVLGLPRELFDEDALDEEDDLSLLRRIRADFVRWTLGRAA